MNPIYILIPLINLLFAVDSYAANTVTSGDAKVSTKTTNVVNGDSSSRTTSDVTINVNGEIKTFHTEGDEDVNWKSEDGKSSVTINNQNKSNVETKTEAKADSSNSSNDDKPSPTPSSGQTYKMEPVKDKIEEKKESVFAFIYAKVDFLHSFTTTLLKKIFG